MIIVLAIQEMKVHMLEGEPIIPRPRKEVLAFFSDAFNLERQAINNEPKT